MKRTVRTNWKGPPRANAVKLGTILYDTVNGSNSGVSRKTRPPTLCGPSLAKAGARMNGRDKLRRSTGPNDKSLVGSSLGSAPRRRRERERERMQRPRRRDFPENNASALAFRSATAAVVVVVDVDRKAILGDAAKSFE